MPTLGKSKIIEFLCIQRCKGAGAEWGRGEGGREVLGPRYRVFITEMKTHVKDVL